MVLQARTELVRGVEGGWSREAPAEARKGDSPGGQAWAAQGWACLRGWEAGAGPLFPPQHRGVADAS